MPYKGRPDLEPPRPKDDITAIYNEVNMLRRQQGLKPLNWQEVTFGRIEQEKKRLLQLTQYN